MPTKKHTIIKYTYRTMNNKAQADFNKFKRLAEKEGYSANRLMENLISEYVNKKVKP